MISVVIRTKNSEATLEQLLKNLGQEPEDEIIVVDSGSTDGTLRIAEEAKAKVFHLSTGFHYSTSLNLGFEAAKSDWVLSLSSHCIPLGSALLPQFKAALRLDQPGVVAIYGSVHLSSQIDRVPKSTLVRAEEFLRHGLVPGGNGNALYRKEAWERHRFSLLLPTCEDLEWYLWAVNQGYSTLLLPQAAVLYRNQSSLNTMFKKGLMETRVSNKLLFQRRAGVRQIALSIGSLIKMFVKRRISAAAFARQVAHRTGAIIGSWMRPYPLTMERLT